jgi:hypothetical protein
MRFLLLAPLVLACDCDDTVTCTTSDGRMIDVGDTFFDGCNTCTCGMDGTVACTKRACIDAGPPFDAAFDGGFDSGIDADVDGAATPDAAACATTDESTLAGVHIVFPAQRCSFTLAEAAAGIEIDYDVVVGAGAPAMVRTRPQDGGGCGMPGPSGLIVFEDLSGGGQRYCRCDEGLCPGGETMSSLVEGTHRATLMWTGRNWMGPSDTGMPLGAPFPAGEYVLRVSSVGRAGATEYSVEGTLAIELTP